MSVVELAPIHPSLAKEPYIFRKEAPFDPIFSGLELGKRVIQVNGTFARMYFEGERLFQSIERFRESPVEPLPRNNPKKVLLANGFSPSPELILEAIEDYLSEPYSRLLNTPCLDNLRSMTRMFREQSLEMLQRLSGLKSNDMLVPFAQKLEDYGHEVRFGYDGPNEAQTSTLHELLETAKDFAPDGHLVIVGLSMGGVYARLAAEILLAKNGVAPVVVTAASPELSMNNLEKFSRSRGEMGILSLIHGIAEKRMRDDPMRSSKYEGASLLQEYMQDFAVNGQNPRIKVISYHTETDSTVPQPEDKDSIEVGGVHAGVLFQPKLIGHLARALSLPYKELQAS